MAMAIGSEESTGTAIVSKMRPAPSTRSSPAFTELGDRTNQSWYTRPVGVGEMPDAATTTPRVGLQKARPLAPPVPGWASSVTERKSGAARIVARPSVSSRARRVLAAFRSNSSVRRVASSRPARRSRVRLTCCAALQPNPPAPIRKMTAARRNSLLGVGGAGVYGSMRSGYLSVRDLRP